MKPGEPAICSGTVIHHRVRPADHKFSYSVDQLWFDPDSPGQLTKQSWLWSHDRPAPARFRRSDYGGASEGSLGAEARSDLQPVLGFVPAGPVRVATQIRRWGWLFNPITLFLVWDQPETHPVGAVLEVTNTPWKERHRYPVALRFEAKHYVARFKKELHVSPFLDESFDYEFSLADSNDNVSYRLNVIDANENPILRTAVHMKRHPATSANLTKEVFRSAMSTRKVSVGIHAQAAKLLAKRVPFVAHPDKRNPTSAEHHD